MDIRQTRLVEDMAGLFRGELTCDAISTSLYATDGSLHQITPLAVACPRDRDDLLTLVNYAAERAVIAANPLPPFPNGFLLGAQEAVAEIWFRYPK